MKQPISDYKQDDEGHWVAILTCRHTQHVRHSPPWFIRPWTLTLNGRTQMLGHELNCKKCDQSLPPDC
ncbi:MAG: DUF3565 domain-containing protein [Burkholderiaceae bacterium]